MPDGGSIVNIITMASHGGEPVLTGYAASKGALATLTRNAGLRAAAAPDPRQRAQHRLDGDRGRARRADARPARPRTGCSEADASRPLGRLLRPQDIAPMVTYLLSDASAMVTGSVIDFDQTVLGPYGEHTQAAVR